MYNHHNITIEFEKAISEYTKAPFVITVDSQSSAMFLSLWYEHVIMNRTSDTIIIPSHTYMSVPCEIRHCGLNVGFEDSDPMRKGEYQLIGSRIYDSALLFTTGMYRPGFIQCCSFTGPFKTLSISKGGCILTDDENFYLWAKKARFSGRSELSYHDDNFDNNPVIGWNMYLVSELATRGLMLMQSFYKNGTPQPNEPVELPYPDLSKFKLWK